MIGITHIWPNGTKDTQWFQGIDGARRHVSERLGHAIEVGPCFAYGKDGSGKIQVHGATLGKLFERG